jgi:hypothetical protein
VAELAAWRGHGRAQAPYRVSAGTQFDLGQTIRASFANTRTAEERRQAHEQELAA